MIRCSRSIAAAGTTSAVSSSAGSSSGTKPIETASSANSAAVIAATIQRRRLDGGVPTPCGNRWITHSSGQPRANPNPARGSTDSIRL